MFTRSTFRLVLRETAGIGKDCPFENTLPIQSAIQGDLADGLGLAKYLRVH